MAGKRRQKHPSLESTWEMDDTPTDYTNDLGQVKELIRKETRDVRVWRIIVTLAMIAVAATITTFTYNFLTNQEIQDFKASYDQISTAITESLVFHAIAIQQNYKSFSDHVTSFAMSSNLTWPFVTIPDIGVHGTNLRQATRTVGFWMTHEVLFEEKDAWAAYSVQNSGWYGSQQFVPAIYTVVNGDEIAFDIGPGPYSPVWQLNPDPYWPLVNFDMMPHQLQRNAIDELRHAVMGTTSTSSLAAVFPDATNHTPYPDEPYTSIFQPVFDSFDSVNATRTALITGFLRWGVYLTNLLPDSRRGINVVLNTKSCNKTFSWELNGGEAVFLGEGDFHEQEFDEYRASVVFDLYDDAAAVEAAGGCIFDVHVYPSSAFVAHYTSDMPMVITIVVGAVFLFMILVFFAYDLFQRRRNEKVLVNAAKSNAVVSSLFPTAIRERLFARQGRTTDDTLHIRQRTRLTTRQRTGLTAQKHNMKRFLERDDSNLFSVDTRPIADLFPDTTIFFGDIVGFTAWSSVREPAHVFTLLETIYLAFDDLAKSRKVFKVETVGDCYVAVAGLPDPCSDHAVVVARFAEECLRKVGDLTSALETSLGPDTGDLTVRIGLHSGPVTAGVLRGERARFQLFGDTMNVAARMESTGLPNRIHMSRETADLLCMAGKDHWVAPRDDKVIIKGKGEMQTFWLQTWDETAVPSEVEPEWASLSVEDVERQAKRKIEQDKRERLIKWQVDVFTQLLKQILARRKAFELHRARLHIQEEDEVCLKEGSTPLDEVEEIIELPEFNPHVARLQESSDKIDLSPAVLDQLRHFIMTVSNMYRGNDFHNFEHACHVSMSVTKLLARIRSPSDLMNTDTVGDTKTKARKKMATLHDHTYGITSDPLTQFSVVFAALIHDVDHSGVPNSQLVNENRDLAAVFNEKSVAEQNSISISWDLLLQDSYKDLRDAISQSKHEMARFRQLVVQTVLATDIVDKELKKLRNDRWDRAFKESPSEENPRDVVNRKATIVIEHLIQASDVSHTMQHWHIYRKWNERFFLECYKAFLDGRAEKDPTEGWYKGELGFFDFYIIPLAKKLKDCGVFGVSSDEYLNYAKKNRQEWEDRGREVLAEMLQKASEIYGGKARPLLRQGRQASF